jgi:hypothetical protein
MSRWTATRLAQHTTALLRDARLILVSNRAPYSHCWPRQALLAHSRALIARGKARPVARACASGTSEVPPAREEGIMGTA